MSRLSLASILTFAVLISSDARLCARALAPFRVQASASLKLTPEPAPAAKARWKEFRKNEKASSMKSVCWKVKVHYSFEDEIKTDLNGDLHFRVSLFAFSEDADGTVRKRNWKDAVNAGAFPKVHDDDVLVFIGKFINVGDSGSLNFVATKIENLGPED